MMAMTRRRFGALLGAIPLLSTALTIPSAMAAKKHKIAIKQFVFEPAELTVAVGDEVTWTNFDFVPHTATELEDHDWDTEELKEGEHGAVVFSTAGTFDYYCVFHPNMRGKITVVDG